MTDVWFNAFTEANKARDLLSGQLTEMALAILAGEPGRMLGRPVEFSLTWPEGRPFNFTDDELRAWAAKHLEAVRRRSEWRP